MQIKELKLQNVPISKHLCNNHKVNQYGFGLMDSLIALSLLAALMTGIVFYNSNANKNKEAQQLAAQTNAFAKIFAWYMNNEYENLKQMQLGSIVTLSPQNVIGWPVDIAQSNMYKQIPCVSIVKNPSTGDLEAIMFYVGSKDISQSKFQIIRDASLLLGNKGGLFNNGKIKGNSGWSINRSSIFLNSAGQCGGSIPKTTVAVNIDLMPEWNQNLQPDVSINKTQDKHNDALSLPGHIQNSNTPKSNMYFAKNKGIILDNSNVINPVKLVMNDDGEYTHSPSISLGNNDVTTLTADTIQPKQQMRSGAACLPNEIGKTVLDQGVQDPALVKVLARSTLVCSENVILCDNGYKTCYLPTQSNTITYQNNTAGIQNHAGIFLCPTVTPFIVNATSSNGGSYIQGAINGYKVAIGYQAINLTSLITSATCSNMPIYSQ
jgi:hypothetical protein